MGDNYKSRARSLAPARSVRNRGMTVARASTCRTERRSNRSYEFRWRMASSVAAVAVALGALALELSAPSVLHPEIGLIIIMAIVAGFLASVTMTRAGTTIIFNPAVCLSFAALMSYGLASAIVAQLSSVVVVHWRTRRSPRRSFEKAVQFSASLLASAVV